MEARILIPNQENFIKEGQMKSLKWEPLDYKITPGMFEPLTKKKKESMIIQNNETGNLLKEIEECKERSNSIVVKRESVSVPDQSDGTDKSEIIK